MRGCAVPRIAGQGEGGGPFSGAGREVVMPLADRANTCKAMIWRGLDSGRGADGASESGRHLAATARGWRRTSGAGVQLVETAPRRDFSSVQGVPAGWPERFCGRCCGRGLASWNGLKRRARVVTPIKEGAGDWFGRCQRPQGKGAGMAGKVAGADALAGGKRAG